VFDVMGRGEWVAWAALAVALAAWAAVIAKV
jgi:hypothetical protein